MPRKKNRRKERQAARRAEEAAKKPKVKPRVAMIAAPHASGLGMAMLAAAVLRHSKESN